MVAWLLCRCHEAGSLVQLYFLELKIFQMTAILRRPVLHILIILL